MMTYSDVDHISGFMQKYTQYSSAFEFQNVTRKLDMDNNLWILL